MGFKENRDFWYFGHGMEENPSTASVILWLSFCCIFQPQQPRGLRKASLFLQPPKLCHQVRVDVRRPGVDLQLQHCQIEERESCKNGQELQEFSFKTSDCDSKCYAQTLRNRLLNSTILMCKDGLCKEYSQEYECLNVQTYLDQIREANQCDCGAFEGTFYSVVEYLHLTESKCPEKKYQRFLGCHQVSCFSFQSDLFTFLLTHDWLLFGAQTEKNKEFAR